MMMIKKNLYEETNFRIQDIQLLMSSIKCVHDQRELIPSLLYADVHDWSWLTRPERATEIHSVRARATVYNG
jgi:hypothetical protein